MQNSWIEDLSLEGKTALVTGGTKGIGKAIADRLAQAGATVAVTARNRPEGEGSHHYIAADLTSAEGPAEVAREVKEKFGGVDILIDNAGGMTAPGGGFSTLTDADWESELRFNLLSVIRLDRELLPMMLEKGSGVVIHMSSLAGKHPLWDLNMAYAASKAALNSYSKSLANEVTGKGIRVLTVSPGGVATAPVLQLFEQIATATGNTVDAVFNGFSEKFGGVPMGRLATPEEVAAFIGFLVSPAAAYLTSTNYAIDGGALSVV